MALEMRTACERCDDVLAPDGDAMVCSFECTFCPACAAELAHVCPNCGGELVSRPHRRLSPSDLWLQDLSAALARHEGVTLARLVPGVKRHELVITTRESPPDAGVVAALWDALGGLISRDDSPVLDRVDEASTWHFEPALDHRTSELLRRLDRDRALVVLDRGG